MTTTLHRFQRRPRVVTALIAGSVLAGSLVLGTAGARPAGAADPPTYREVRLCDPSGCLFAWHVVDSDGDGVSDADELMAGTDPHDATSKPSLQIVAEVAIKRQLPSFEAGLSTFVILPADIHTIAGGLTKDPLEAFPLGGRKSTLERLGISSKKLSEMGIDPSRSGMTIGLDHPSKDGGPAPVRVGGMDVRLISDGKADFSGGILAVGYTKDWAKHGPVISTEKTDDQIIMKYGDGAKIVATFDENGWKRTDTYDEKGNLKQSPTRVDPEPLDIHLEPAHEDPSGSHDEPGSGHDPHHPPKADEPDEPQFISHIDPDADTTVVTPEQVDLALRSLGAVVLTMQGVNGPELDPSTLVRPGTTILVDPDLASSYGILLDAPRVTTAQPEVRPDLPSPLDAAPPGKSGGTCNGLC